MVQKLTHYRSLLTLSLPILLSSLTTTIISITAMPILGHYSVEAMGASAVYSSITIIFSNVLLASFTGYRILASKALGADKNKDAEEFFSISVYFALLLSCIIGSFLLFFSSELTYAISHDSAVASLAISYIKIGACIYPLHGITYIIFISFSLQKQTKVTMYLSIFSELLHVFLCTTLVFGYLKFPALGATGAIWAQLIQAIITFILAIITFNLSKYKIKLRFSINRKKFYHLFSLSCPSMISMCIDYLGSFMMFAMISYFLDKESLAAGRICFTLLLLCFSIITAMSSGFMIIGGRALGQGSNSQFLLYSRYNRNILIATGAILAIPLLIMPDQILNLVTSFQAVRKIALFPMTTIAISILLTCWSYSNAVSLRLLEKVKTDMLCNISAIWMIQIPVAYYLGVYFDLGLFGFFIAVLLYDVTYACSTYYWLQYFLNRKGHDKGSLQSD